MWWWAISAVCILLAPFGWEFAMWRHRRRMARWRIAQDELRQRRLYKPGTRVVDTTIV